MTKGGTLLAALALLGALGTGVAEGADPFEAFALVKLDGGARAPHFTLPDLTGRPTTVAAPTGSAVILVFWGTW